MRKLYFLVFLFHQVTCLGYSVKDFLCGCDYCNTINPSQPLSIATHHMNCESFKKNKIMKKLMQAQSKKSTMQSTQPEQIKSMSLHDQLSKSQQEKLNLEKKIQEKNNFISMLQQSSKSFINGWIYEPEHFRWIYVSKSFAPYIYSEELGWIFIKKEYYYVYSTLEWKKIPKAE